MQTHIVENMKHIIIPFIILVNMAISAFAELDENDLNRIRLIIKEEVKEEVKASETRMKEDIIASETRMKEHVDTRSDGLENSADERSKSVNKRLDDVGGKIVILTAVVCSLIAIIGVVIGLPAWRNRKDHQDLKKKMEAVIRRIEALENGQPQTQ